jgi:hypothetical protein
LGIVGAEDWGLAIGEEIHDGVLYFGIWEWVAADIASTGVPLEQLDIRDEDTMAVSAGEETVAVGHVYHRSAFDAVFVTDVEADVVLHVEFP